MQKSLNVALHLENLPPAATGTKDTQASLYDRLFVSSGCLCCCPVLAKDL